MSNLVDEYVKTKVLPEQQEIVATIRALMRESAPDSTEMISYGIIAWKASEKYRDT